MNLELIAMLIPFTLGIWVFFDARSRGKDTPKALLWGVGTFLILIIVLPLWLFLRPSLTQPEDLPGTPRANIPYPYLKKQNPYCSHCQKTIECLGIDQPRFCPYCGQQLPEQDNPPITINPEHKE